jgi:hypothetical protein
VASAEEAALGAPLHVVLGEAVDLAGLVEHYWEPQTDGRGGRIPGFSAVAATSQVTRSTPGEMRELQLAIVASHNHYLVIVQAPNETPLDRADFVSSEIRSALEFAFDDGVQDEADEQLTRVNQSVSNSSAQDAMALGLEGYAGLGQAHRERLAAFGFDVALLDEALTLAAALRERSAFLLTQTNPDAQRQALALRNRLLTALLDRTKAVRRTACYVFRHHPDIARKFTSPYERRRRAAHRRRAAVEPISPHPTQSQVEA